jgi:hypothetical protein
MPTTLALVSACRVFHDDKAGRISTQGLASAVKCLIPESQGEWHITIASQVKLWAPQHHQDIGWATAHPDLWDRSRHMTLMSWHIHLNANFRYDFVSWNEEEQQTETGVWCPTRQKEHIEQ